MSEIEGGRPSRAGDWGREVARSGSAERLTLSVEASSLGVRLRTTGLSGWEPTRLRREGESGLDGFRAS